MYVPLHTHSDFSLLESCVKVRDLVAKAAALGYRALALTDHNTMGGLVEFYHVCLEHKIKPIFGIELDVEGLAGCDRLVLLAADQQGYSNLLQLASHAKPCPMSKVVEYRHGLIAILNGQDAKKAIMGYHQLAKHFANNLYVELFMDDPASIAEAKTLLNSLPISGLIAGSNVSYLEKQQLPLLEVMTGSNVQPRAAHTAPRLLKSLTQIQREFQLCPQVVANTWTVAERCEVELRKETVFPSLPERFDLPALAWEGAKKRYGTLTPKVAQRLEYELSVISEMGLSDYFLIVADIVRYAKQADIPVGPGRGSAVGSLVAYCLEITEVDPIVHNLYFERFLNKKRRNLPDIDLDICYQKREQLINYVVQRFGSEHVARIGTYGSYGYKNAVKEVTKVLGTDHTHLAEQLAEIKQYFSTHASGIIITPKPVTCYSGIEYVNGMAVTQLPMDALESIGVLKIDFLGLRTLTILNDIVALVRSREPEFDIKHLTLDDISTYELLAQGMTLGIFQMESELFQDLLPKIKPQSFSDLVATLALVRPGPLQQVPVYIKRKAGLEPIHYPHPHLAVILQETYGLMVYQEQVMQVAHELAGFSLEDADLLRRAMSKKDQATMQSLRDKFVAGCQAHGLKFSDSNQLYLQIARFADYAFNKAHSTAYALITWQLAYLKTHYPKEFYLVLLKHTSDVDKQGQILRECLMRGIKVLPPDVRYSEAEVCIEGSALRIGLTNLKYVGAATAQTIIAERSHQPFRNLADLLQRVELSANVKYALAYAGCLDGYGGRQQTIKQIAIREGHSVPNLNELELLEKEKEIVGMYLSGHPLERWEKFLHQLQPGLGECIAGHVNALRESGRTLVGTLIDNRTYHRFVVPARVEDWCKFLQIDALVALFGQPDSDNLRVEWVLPLKPMLLIKPRLETIAMLKDYLLTHHGNTPVLLSVGPGVIQLTDPVFWVNPVSEVITSLSKLSDYVHWIDPWHCRDLPNSMEITNNNAGVGGFSDER